MLSEAKLGLRLVARHPLAILAVAGLAMGVTFLHDRRMAPQFEAKSKVLIMDSAQGSQTLRDVLPDLLTTGAETALANGVTILHSRPIAQRALDTLSAGTPSYALPLDDLLARYGIRSDATSHVLEIYARDTDPGRAAAVVNAVADAFIADDVLQRTSQASQSLAFIDDQLRQVQGQLADEEDRQRAFKQHGGLLSIPNYATHLDSMSADARKTQMESESKVAALEQRVAAMRQQVGLTDDQAARALALQDDPLLRKLQDRLSAEKSDDVVDTLTPAAALSEQHRRTVERLRGELRGRIGRALGVPVAKVDPEAVFSPLVADLVKAETELRSARAEAAFARTETARVEGQVARFPTEEETFGALERRADVLRQTYRSLLEKRIEVNMAREATGAAARIVEYAVPPKIPFAPTKKKDLEGSLFAGLLAGLACALALEYLEQGGIAPEGVAPELTGVPHLGDLVFTDRTVPVRVLKDGSDTPLAERFRMVRSGLRAIAERQEAHLVGLLTPRHLPEKAIVTLNLAESLAKEGQKVLLIDACGDRGLSRLFEREAARGLTDVLTGQASWQDAVVPTDNPDLALLPYGSRNAEAENEVEPRDLAGLVDTEAGAYAWVLVDVPPLLDHWQGLALASQLPLGVVLADPDRTRLADLRVMQHLLRLSLTEPKAAIGIRIGSRLGPKDVLDAFLERYARRHQRAWRPKEGSAG